MPYVIDYLLKVSLGLLLVYLFYKLILSGHTFYTWNRWCLLIYCVLAFLIPLIDINPAISEAGATQSRVVEAIPVMPEIGKVIEIQQAVPEEDTSFQLSVWDIVFGLYVAGCLVRLLQTGIQFLSFSRIKKGAEIATENGVWIYDLKLDIQPFSFWRGIYLNHSLYGESDRRKIIEHESVHVRQLHSFDILFSELICAVCWFNPAVWFIRHAIRENLEYIADREVIQKGAERREYQYLLLNVAGNKPAGMVNHFTFSSLKKRIIMMNKARSARIHLVKFVFILPLISVMLLAFRSRNPGFFTNNAKVEQGARRAMICGLLRDGETGEPLRGYELRIWYDTVSFSIDRSVLRIKDSNPVQVDRIKTDDDGFFFWEEKDPKRMANLGSTFSYTFKDDEYNEFSGNFSANIDKSAGYVMNDVYYVIKKSDKNSFHDWYMNESLGSEKQTVNPYELKEELLAKLPVFQEEHDLKQNFRKAYKEPSQIITKFQNGYFDQKRDLLGYVGEMKFYIDGEEVTYDKVNYAFRFRQPHLVNSNRMEIRERYATKMYYYTSDTNRDAPPVSIVKSKNVEWVDVASFDMSILDRETYYLDGFWQIKGVGSNMRPERSEIKRIALLKGKLARYYNKNFDKVWWVETRPADEVIGRPDFAKL